uniref:Uncharacterized protein n=1 Tax=Oryza glumipatula TaxID=40148 RepID=A0A0E0BH20_9ORYZ
MREKGMYGRPSGLVANGPRILTKPPAAKGGRLGCHSSNGTPTSNNNLLSCISLPSPSLHIISTDWKKGSEAEIGKCRFRQEGRTEWEFEEKLRGIVVGPIVSFQGWTPGQH